MRTVGRIAFAALVPLFIVWALLAAELSRVDAGAHATATASLRLSNHDDTAAVSPRTSAPLSEDDQALVGQSETDLYGNEVDDAVAEYGLDAAGSMYELHAPQVELPHLGSPKS